MLVQSSGIERRDARRDEVHYRTRATRNDGMEADLQVVDVSASGFMARTDAPIAPGDTLSIRLPVVGLTKAEVRWALGGRVGCQFPRMMDFGQYLMMLGELVKAAA